MSTTAALGWKNFCQSINSKLWFCGLVEQRRDRSQDLEPTKEKEPAQRRESMEDFSASSWVNQKLTLYSTHKRLKSKLLWNWAEEKKIAN